MEKTKADLFGERIVSDVFEGPKNADELAFYLDPQHRKQEAPINLKGTDSDGYDSVYVPVVWYVFSDNSFAMFNGGCGYEKNKGPDGSTLIHDGFGVPLIGMVDGPALEV